MTDKNIKYEELRNMAESLATNIKLSDEQFEKLYGVSKKIGIQHFLNAMQKALEKI